MFGVTIKIFIHLLKVFGGGTALGSQLRKSLFFSCVIVLNLNPHFIEFSSIKFSDFITDFCIIITIISLGMEVTKVFVKVCFWWLDDSLGLFDQVIFNLSGSMIVHLISIFVLGGLSSSLVKNSFSNVLVFDDSGTFITVLFHKGNQILVGLILRFLIILLNQLIEVLLNIEEFLDVLFSSFSKIFIKGTLHLCFITNFICCRHWTCADLFEHCNPSTTRSNSS